MDIFTSTQSLQSAVRTHKQAGLHIGFVPTMGNLHEGHLSLVHKAREMCDWVVSSIFVNPLQFAANEDLDNYPRTLERDQTLLESSGCDALFLPDVDTMYPDGLAQMSTVHVPIITQRLCGASRPGHFDGVSTVVSKLFNLVNPDSAFFGKKDFQQLATIRKMVQDLNYPINIIGVEIARAEDKLALSSRNSYLSHTERALAPNIYRILQQTKERILDAEQNYKQLEKIAITFLKNNGLEVDYFEVCSAKTLLPATRTDTDLVILCAASLGNTRLIDNVTLILN